MDGDRAVHVVVLIGALDLRRTSEVRTTIYGALARQDGDVVIDLSEVTSVDLTTLRMLAIANRVAERTGRAVVLRGCSTGVRRLLHLSRLRPLIPVEPDATAFSDVSHPAQ